MRKSVKAYRWFNLLNDGTQNFTALSAPDVTNTALVGCHVQPFFNHEQKWVKSTFKTFEIVLKTNIWLKNDAKLNEIRTDNTVFVFFQMALNFTHVSIVNRHCMIHRCTFLIKQNQKQCEKL